ncbi:MAG: PAS domain-containing sensor histidine kinase [Leptolyngbyaceae bacterium]|nr:PAS domain-containing sensor histidine kinase [Leptolyngbyaceae bacterium]
MEFISFLVGLGCGLLLLARYRAQSTRKLQTLLSDLRPEATLSPFSATSQLSLAIAYQQQIQQSLETKLDIYHQLLQSAPVGFLWIDEENRLIWSNPSAQKLLRMAPTDDQEPRLLLELVRSYELDTLIEEIRASQEQQQRDWIFYPYNPDPTRLAKQTSHALRGYGFPLESKNVAIFIESRQEALTLLQQRDRWASDVAHELKTPLTSIRLIAETLQTRLEGPLVGWTERLINQTIRLSNLVQDLLELGKLEQGAVAGLSLSKIDIVDLIQSAWSSLEPLYQKKNLKLAYEGPQQLVLQLDETRFYRVLTNIFDNSIKYSPPWGTVHVYVSLEAPTNSYEAAMSNQVLCLRIVDMGAGFAEHDLPYVFERFYRADSARAREAEPLALSNDGLTSELGRSPQPLISPQPSSRTQAVSSSLSIPPSKPNANPAQSQKSSHQGSGLGLSIVQRIVEAHQGTISASNHPEMGGACIDIRLPRMVEKADFDQRSGTSH